MYGSLDLKSMRVHGAPKWRTKEDMSSPTPKSALKALVLKPWSKSLTIQSHAHARGGARGHVLLSSRVRKGTP